MANHCTYVICIPCKIEWCVRCGDAGVVAEVVLKKLQAKISANKAVAIEERCPECRSSNQVFFA